MCTFGRSVFRHVIAVIALCAFIAPSAALAAESSSSVYASLLSGDAILADTARSSVQLDALSTSVMLPTSSTDARSVSIEDLPPPADLTPAPNDMKKTWARCGCIFKVEYSTEFFGCPYLDRGPMDLRGGPSKHRTDNAALGTMHKDAAEKGEISGCYTQPGGDVGRPECQPLEIEVVPDMNAADVKSE